MVKLGSPLDFGAPWSTVQWSRKFCKLKSSHWSLPLHWHPPKKLEIPQRLGDANEQLHKEVQTPLQLRECLCGTVTSSCQRMCLKTVFAPQGGHVNGKMDDEPMHFGVLTIISTQMGHRTLIQTNQPKVDGNLYIMIQVTHTHIYIYIL